jgi:hypothetical protein
MCSCLSFSSPWFHPLEAYFSLLLACLVLSRCASRGTLRIKRWLGLGCFPFCHPTQTSSFHIIVPTSAYPGHYPRHWLFRQSCSRMACGLDTCSSYRPSMRAHRGVIPFQRFVLCCRRPVLSTGLCMGEHEASPKDFTHGDWVSQSLPFWSSLLSSVGLVPLTMVQAYICLLVIATS